MNEQPPKRGYRILRLFCKKVWIDELLGDLEEEFKDNVASLGRQKAVYRYYVQVLLLIRPHILKKRKPSPFMLRNHIRSSYRSLLKNKIYSIINISGLTVGIACCILISLYVRDEMSYDSFFQDSDRIYRVALERVYPNNTRYFGSSPVNLAPTLLENYPEVEEAGRLHRLFFQNEISVRIGEKTFIEDQYLFADSSFFQVFSFEFVEGNATSVLEGPNDVVITESTARKYFGEEAALNKAYNIDTSRFRISGVIKDVPSNSHIGFDVLGNIEALPFLQQAASNNSWVNPWLFTYIKLKEGITEESFEEKLPEMFQSFGLASVLSQLSISEKDYPESGNEFNYFLQPVEDIHLKSNLDVEVQANSNITYVYLLIAVVVFILIISCINFINLATARSAERAKEVGVRKTLGSSKSLLIKQFLTESNLIAIVALVLAIAIVLLSLSNFNTLVGKELSLSLLLNPVLILILLLSVLVIGTLAGLYPAFVITSVNSALVLKGKYSTSAKGVWLRNALIVFQFFISISMISGMMLLDKQMKYMQNKQLGFSKENIVVLEQAQILAQEQRAFRNEILAIEGVKSAAYGFAVPGDFIGNLIVTSEIPDLPQVRTFTVAVDDHYISTLGMEVIEGRGFDPQFNDSLNVVINETAAELLGYENAVGRRLINPSPGPNFSGSFNIIGVVKDYHQHSLHMEIPPMILFNAGTGAFLPRLAVKVETNDVLYLLKEMENTWKEFDMERPISYSFLDESLQELYEADQKTGTVFSLFTMVTIIMACVGLFGLAAYVTQQRTKEIGVRKVLGASLGNIILILSLNFTKLILLSFILAMPLVYFGMDRWMESFAYRTNIDALTLLGAGLLTIVLAWITISYYSIKIAILNPVNSLRDE